MSDQRQSNLFAGESFKNVYKSFSEVNFTSYDFDGIRDSLIQYIRTNYPEDFNDYIDSSEMVAIIELLSYLGTSLAFRADLNARENIIDTAERRESIIKLARMLSYQPKRAIPASGLFKIRSVRTDQSVSDSNGTRLTGNEVFWGDSNNGNWHDQFFTILNAALNPTNKFGRPSKSGTVSGISTDLYQMNNVLGLDVAYPVSINVNGESVGFDIVNPDIDVNIKERHPDHRQAFNLIYRNDSRGVSSPDTGLFFFLKQGNIERRDYQYDYPVPSRIQDVVSKNVNNDDVYVQEINDFGDVVKKWSNVPTLSGNNVIYNSLSRQDRDIFEVISGLDDSISIKFPDGNFGNVPTGLMRTWFRTSKASNIVVRPEDASDLLITIPYFGADGQRYNMSFRFSLEYTISNGSPSETDQQIKDRAPLVYYSQDRMVNNKDYNVFPLSRGNEILKINSINRTFSGHSRYTNNDPTGFHNGLRVFAEDGALFNESTLNNEIVRLDPDVTGNDNTRVLNAISRVLLDSDLYNFYVLSYLYMLPNQDQFKVNADIYWKTFPNLSRGSGGSFVYQNTAVTSNWPYDNTVPLDSGLPFRYVTNGASLVFDVNGKDLSVPVTTVRNNGIAFDPVVTENGAIMLSTSIPDLSKLKSVVPRFRNVLNRREVTKLDDMITNNESIFIKYNVETNEWEASNSGDDTSEYDLNDHNSDWFMCAIYHAPTSTDLPYYELKVRGTHTVFESYNSVKFFWDPEEIAVDESTGRTMRDKITVLSGVNVDSEGNRLNQAVEFDIIDRFIQSDGHVNQSRVKVMPTDSNEDMVPDRPFSFYEIVGPDSEVLFETISDFDGYTTDRIWMPRTAVVEDAIIDFSNSFPPIHNSIYITLGDNARITVAKDPDDSTSVDRHYYLNNNDLFVFDDVTLINEISRQLDLFLMNPQTRGDARRFKEQFKSKSMTVGIPNQRNAENIEMYNFDDRLTRSSIVIDKNHYSRVGRSFGSGEEDSINFKWSHFIPRSQLIDPSKTNIIDMTILTDRYYQEVLNWKAKDFAGDAPKKPTPVELSNSFSFLNDHKSISDEIVFSPAKIKLLFGDSAIPQLRARLKVVKLPDASISDNEIKTGVINAIDNYFSINNWQFGETFYFTEMAAYVHKKLARHISSVILVPSHGDSAFGDLFQIKSEQNELFLSCATPLDVDIVANYNDSNMRR